MPDDLAMTEAEAKEFELMRDEAPVAEPAPQAPPAEAPKAEAAKEQPPKEPEAPKEKPTRLVPIDALHEEREKRKAFERRVAELEKAVSQPKPAAAPLDDIDENQDPLGAIARLKAEIRESKQREEEQRRAQEQMQEVSRRIGSRVQAYAQEHPEYPEQMQFLRQSRASELRTLGMSDDDIVRQIQQEELILGVQALQNDWDPGAKIAELAKLRGWKPKEPEKPAAQDAARLDRLEKGQRAAVSSSAGGGSGPEPDMTLERMLSLDGAAFEAAWNKHAKRLMA